MSNKSAQRRPSGADEGVIIGYRVSRGVGSPLILGAEARLRSGTVIYDGTTIGQGLQTGHGVVIREGCVIGDDVSIWSNSVVDYSCRIGNGAKIHCNCYVAQYTELEEDVFLAPGVTIAGTGVHTSVSSGLGLADSCAARAVEIEITAARAKSCETRILIDAHENTPAGARRTSWLCVGVDACAAPGVAAAGWGLFAA